MKAVKLVPFIVSNQPTHSDAATLKVAISAKGGWTSFCTTGAYILTQLFPILGKDTIAAAVVEGARGRKGVPFSLYATKAGFWLKFNGRQTLALAHRHVRLLRSAGLKRLPAVGGRRRYRLIIE